MPIYKGESNENFESATKIRNIARLKSGRHVVVRCRNATRRRSNSVKVAAPLATCTNEEEHSVIRFLSSEGVKPIEIHGRMKVHYGDACLSLQQMYDWTRKFMNGTSSVTDSPRPGQVHNHLRERLC